MSEKPNPDVPMLADGGFIPAKDRLPIVDAGCLLPNGADALRKMWPAEDSDTRGQR